MQQGQSRQPARHSHSTNIAQKAIRARLRGQLLLSGCHWSILRPRLLLLLLLLLHARTPTGWVQWRRPPCRPAPLRPQVLLRLTVRLMQVCSGERRLLRLRLRMRGKLRLVRREVRLLLLLRVLLLRLLRVLLLLRRGQLLLRMLLHLLLRVALMLRRLRILLRIALLRCRWLGCGAPLGASRPARLARCRLRMPRLAQRLLSIAWTGRLLWSALHLGRRSAGCRLARLQLLAQAIQALGDLQNVVILQARAARRLSTLPLAGEHLRAEQEHS